MKKRLYDFAHTINEDIKVTSFDYSGNQILRKTNSPYMFQNKTLIQFLDLISEMLNNDIECVKKIRIHNNFAVGKHTTYINWHTFKNFLNIFCFVCFYF